ncbi:protein LIFEGUARD 2-like isoform X2 [Papaver somniferum]|uniref:protein LIFEGUARD 2-like isoform X2 n=1 Tax=Papaver somniferum TaxID=3469 RepID=UPI000E6F4B66|nr:protein LIFEGUARD 2-like isoform X2 [Papaver somniferum]
MWSHGKTSGDIESGTTSEQPLLYPMMSESPELRWAFIRKIYTIVSIQLLLTAAVSSVVVFVPAVSHYILYTHAGLSLYIAILITPLIILCLLACFHQKHPVNFILLGIFTVAVSMSVGLSCALTSGKIILEAAVLTAVVVVSLTMYTFWASKRGYDFNFLGPFLFASLIVLIVFAIIQIFFPLGKIGTMIYEGVGAIIFCGYIVYDTDNLIKRYSYDEYIWASVNLYLDIINLFLHLLRLLKAADS